jgi:hypothetical protein
MTTDSSALEPDYFEQIERHFGLRRDGPLMLSPRDWQLVSKWHDQGLPVAVVLRGINRAFDLFDAGGPRSDRINSLSYCEQHVEEAWLEHRELQAAEGSREVAPGLSTAADHFEMAAKACVAAATGQEAPLASLLREAATTMSALANRARKDDADVRQLDAEASALEQRVAEATSGAELAHPLPRFSPWSA